MPLGTMYETTGRIPNIEYKSLTFMLFPTKQNFVKGRVGSCRNFGLHRQNGLNGRAQPAEGVMHRIGDNGRIKIKINARRVENLRAERSILTWYN